MPFGKYQHAISTIHGFSRVGKALAETCFPRQGKKIQQRHSQSPLCPVVHTAKESACGWRSAQQLKCLTSGRSGQMVAQASGKSGENETDIQVANVVGNYQRRALHVAQ